MKVYKNNETINREEEKKIIKSLPAEIRSEIRHIIKRHNEELENEQYSYIKIVKNDNNITLTIYNLLIPYNSSLTPYLETDSLTIGGFHCQKYKIPV